MKILEINTERSWRGGERQTLFNIRGLKACGSEVELLCRKDFPLSQKAKQENIRTHEIKGANDAITFLMAHGSKYDILHAQTAKAQFYAVITKPFHRRPVIYSRRVDFVQKGPLTKWKYLLTDKTIAISEAIKTILTSFGVRNVEVISDAAEPVSLNAARAKMIIAENGLLGKKLIGTTAALVQHKDPLTMVRAIAELADKRKDFVFLHYGDGVLKEQVQNEINKLGIQEQYSLMGFIDQVEDLFSLFEVFVMSSEEEGLGSSVLDAFLYKVPVASTDAGGLKEVVQHHGLICKVKDHVMLADNIDTLMNDEKLKETLTEKAHSYVLREHSIEKIAKEYQALFLRLRK
ncbi:MAG: glycosyltransferase family 4 protein [Bacteroidota bacterium]|nr:glycosyltransferase family 4 protein [Bacteroidota bacterium]